jgi:hypothetical protein
LGPPYIQAFGIYFSRRHKNPFKNCPQGPVLKREVFKLQFTKPGFLADKHLGKTIFTAVLKIATFSGTFRPLFPPKNISGHPVRASLTLVARRPGEAARAHAVAVDALAVPGAVGHLALVVLQLALLALPAWGRCYGFVNIFVTKNLVNMLAFLT